MPCLPVASHKSYWPLCQSLFALFPLHAKLIMAAASQVCLQDGQLHHLLCREHFFCFLTAISSLLQ